MITQLHFQCIGQVAKHCDNEKLCIAIEESKDFDLSNLFCYDLFIEALEHFTDTDPFWVNLWNGGTFTSSCGKIKNHFGLNRVWVCYAYARYLLLNGYNDTPTGFKQKTNDFSLPIPVKELQVFEDKYRNMGFEAYKLTEHFICRNKENFTTEITIDCKSECLCGTETCGGKTKRNTGFRSTVIKKQQL